MHSKMGRKEYFLEIFCRTSGGGAQAFKKPAQPFGDAEIRDD
jgi:hypothetical protein